ncbi:MAG: polysaccharide biosynthesis tyrosine autokinase [Isosphaeraceae bacterium]
MKPFEFDNLSPIEVFPPRHTELSARTDVSPALAYGAPGDVAGVIQGSAGLRDQQVAEPALPHPDGPDLAGLLHALRRRWKLAVVGGVCCSLLAAALVYFLFPPTKYTTSALVFVAASRPKEIFETRETSVVYATYQETQVTLAKSRKVIEAALRQGKVATLPSVLGQNDPINWLSNEIKVDFPRGSEILKISMAGAYPPTDIELLVNAVTDAYMNEIVDQEAGERKARLERLKTLFEDLQKGLSKKRQEYKNAAESVGASNQQNAAIRQQLLIQHLGQARQELLRLGSDLRHAQARLRILEARREGAPESGPESESDGVRQLLETDPELREIQDRLATLDREVQAMKRTARKANDPAIYSLNQEIALLKKDMNQRLKSLQQDRSKGAAPGKPAVSPQVAEARQYVEILREQERLLRDEVAVLDQEMSRLNTRSMDFHWLEDEITLATETARTVGTEVQSMSVELKAPPRTRLIERARAPSLVAPSRRKQLAAGAAAGVLFGYLGLLSFWEYRARRIATANEVVRGLGLKLVGSLPVKPAGGRARGDLVRERLMTDSIDAIRTTLLNASRRGDLRVVMVASALKGEGKTSLSCQLAASMARAGRRTLLIDCDLRQPSVHKAFSAPLAPGVGEVLRAEATLEEAAWESPVASLTVIPAGCCDAATTELLARNHVRDLFARLRERYDFIVVDSAPLLLATDSLIVSQHVDAVIFSVLRDVSQVPPVQAAYERLTGLGVRVLGAVISGVHQTFYGYRTYPYLHGESGA